MDHPGLQVQEHSTRDVVLIIGLGEIFFLLRKKENMSVQHSHEYFGLVFKISKYATITPSSGKKMFCMCVTKKGGQDHFTDTIYLKQNY